MLKLSCSTTFIIFLVLSLAASFVETSQWTYGDGKGPAYWASKNPVCGKDNQSPIDISTNSVVPDHSLKPLKFHGYDQPLNSTSYKHNGHTITLNFGESNIFVTDELGQEYKALQLHFHWRKDEKSGGGSEHTLNGNHYPVELHIVHIKKGYSSLDSVKDVRDGLLVLGVFLEVDSSLSYNQDPFFKVLEAAPKYKKDNLPNVNVVQLDDLLPTSKSFYRYFGSLTTPPCYESVKWTVFQNSFKISKKTLEDFESKVFLEEFNESFKGSYTRLGGNYRPVMALNGRQITEYKIFDEDFSHHDWSYTGDKGPLKWHEIKSIKDNSCAANHQSPINIKTELKNIKALKAKPIQFSKSYSEHTNGEIVNNGHSITYHLDESYELTFHQSDKSFKALQLHFHWAPVMFKEFNKKYSTKGGSEHTIDSNHYPIEIHIVHKNKEGKTTPTPDGLAVLGVFMEPSEENEVDQQVNDAVSQLTSQFKNAKHKNKKATISFGPILSNLLPRSQKFYRYYGSLTTPACSEVVMWTVYEQVMKVSEQNFFEFQKMLSFSEDTDKIPKSDEDNTEAYIAGNYRPVQDLNGRDIYYFSEGQNEELAHGSIVFYAIVITVALVIIICGVFVYKRSLSRNRRANYSKGKQEDQSPEAELTSFEA